jgi:hypothetical protein
MDRKKSGWHRVGILIVDWRFVLAIAVLIAVALLLLR